MQDYKVKHGKLCTNIINKQEYSVFWVANVIYVIAKDNGNIPLHCQVALSSGIIQSPELLPCSFLLNFACLIQSPLKSVENFAAEVGVKSKPRWMLHIT